MERAEYLRGLPAKKKQSLGKLVTEHFGPNWKEDANLQWYKDLLLTTTGEIGDEDNVEDDQDTENVDEVCECLEDDVGFHI